MDNIADKIMDMTTGSIMGTNQYTGAHAVDKRKPSDSGKSGFGLNEAVLSCPLFNGIDAADADAMLSCLSARRKSYKRGEFVFLAGGPARYAGVLLSGELHVIQEDYWGSRSIITDVVPGDLFGEAFAGAGLQTLPVSVIAVQDSDVLFIDFERITKTCSSMCGFHSRLIDNLMEILSRKNVALTRKIEHMSKRTTREKVLSYLSGIAMQEHSANVEIPFNRQELADYLGVDRSALSGELSRMQKRGLIRYKRNRFTLMPHRR
ncbi:MAG: Crp/Fnr family transcriptional regulator [Coriobacteriales bacterium]|jgi:CRP-like cAMP-binding protein|nr:Crp/Fnr family transcriptional regulator [Coriobacteriales bacterium]